jgi:amidase
VSDLGDPALRPAVELVADLARGEVGARELLEHYLERVARLNPSLNAVVTLDAEGARRAADAADEARARGRALGPLHGLPMTVKDTLETAGLRTTAGAPPFAEHVPERDATAVARLRGAGAVVFGKTNTPPFAADVQTFNPLFGTTRNPWDPERSPGGSSGGSATAVAAGLSAAEVGSDIGGSIRNPAHYCGVYGLKPTHGVIPLRGHIPGPPGTLGEIDLAVLGPLARSADDLELLLDVLAGPDEARATAWQLALPAARHQTLRDYRVAAWLDDPACPVDDAVRGPHEAAVAALRAAGVRVDTVARPVPSLAAAFDCYERLLWPLMSAGLLPDEMAELVTLADGAAHDDASAPVRHARASVIRMHDWIAANEERERLRAAWAAFFRDFDVLLCPVTPVAAVPHQHEGTLLSRTLSVNGATRPYLDQIVWAGLATMALLPATCAPVGRAAGGLPVGLQVVGPYLEDRTTIDFARRMADVVGGYEAPPETR